MCLKGTQILKMSLPKNEVYFAPWRSLLFFSKEEGLMFVDRVLSGRDLPGQLDTTMVFKKLARFAK